MYANIAMIMMNVAWKVELRLTDWTVAEHVYHSMTIVYGYNRVGEIHSFSQVLHIHIIMTFPKITEELFDMSKCKNKVNDLQSIPVAIHNSYTVCVMVIIAYLMSMAVFVHLLFTF